MSPLLVRSQHSDVDELAERADQLIQESREALRRHPAARPPGRSAQTRKREQASMSYCLADLRATQQGRLLGRQFGHDSFALARWLGLAVERVPLSQLQRADRPRTTILARLWRLPGQPPFVQLADELDGRQALTSLAHEAGHFLGLPDERLCDQFAAAFMKVEDDELPGGRWGKWRCEAEERARRDAATAARARR
jgi:hypothetical protein